MKTVLYLTSFSLLFSVIACRRNNPMPAPVAPVDQLPAYTETGANTFGCLIDGQVFVPGKPAFSSYITLQCEYQILNYTEKYFGLSATNFIGKKNVSFGTNKKGINEETYALGYYYTDSIYGGCGDFVEDYIRYYTKPPSQNGELVIKKFDTINQIISGTFWFDAIDTTSGKVLHVTDGRFDVRYTK